jgi:hypothetical protein
MVRDILQDTQALFGFSGFKMGISKGVGRINPPIARLEFLKSRIESLEKIIREINSRPINVLASRESVVSLHKTTRITSREYHRSIQNGAATQPPSWNRKLAVRFLPRKVIKTDKVSGLDIREHRDIKNRLATWMEWISLIGEKLSREEPKDPNTQKQEIHWARRCKAMQRMLGNLLNLPLFNEVSDHIQPVSMSPIYRNVPLYNNFYKLNRDIEAGISNILGDFLALPLSRTFELYELWAYLRILRAAIELFGIDLAPADLFKYNPDNGSVRIQPENVTVKIGGGFGLSFQRRYREYWYASDSTGSFSRPMIPDISIRKEKSETHGARIIVLDAKYRIESGLNEAISSIHMYRDALVHGDSEGGISGVVVGAYLLSPHKPVFEKSWKKSSMPGRLFHPVYRGNFRFGAVTLYPGMPSETIHNSLITILEDAGYSNSGPRVHHG